MEKKILKVSVHCLIDRCRDTTASVFISILISIYFEQTNESDSRAVLTKSHVLCGNISGCV